jgi:predicted RNA-binding protein with PUA-like domain
VSAARRGKQCWLVKSEPDVYGIDQLARDGRTMWDGVRNYQARNLMRDDMHVGDPVLFYHSNAKPMCVAGVARVASESYADPTAFDKQDKHYDPKSKQDDPTWMLVDIEHVETFDVPVTREVLSAEPSLSDMMLLRRGSRLSVQPVTAKEFQTVLKLAKREAKTAGR